VILDTRDKITSDVSEAEKEGSSERRTYSWTRQDRCASKRSAQGSGGPRNKNSHMPDGDLKLVSEQLKAERRTISLINAKGGAEPKKLERKMDFKVAVEQGKVAERRVIRQFNTMSEGDICKLSNMVAETLQPVVEQKIRQTVKGMVEEVIKSLSTVQSNWQRDYQETVKDIVSTNKNDLLAATKGLEDMIKQVVTDGQTGLKQGAEALLLGIESSVSECDKSWKKVGKQLEKSLGSHGATIKDAIFAHGDGIQDAVSDLVLKETETQRHLTTMYAELSELRRKIEGIPGAWQYQQTGGNGGVRVENLRVLQHEGVVAVGAGNDVNDGVDHAVVGGAAGHVNDLLDDVAAGGVGGEGGMPVEQVLQEFGLNGRVDPALLDEPDYEPCDDGSSFRY
jgi:hypothetical protein